MNEQNFEYLKDQLKYTGFGTDLDSQLKENLQKPQTEFSLSHLASYGKDEVASQLNFKKSTESERFFFNSYVASLKKDNSQDTTRQTFPINKDGNVTRKEAYNLLDGRAVNKDLVSKDGKLYVAWISLNFKETTPSGNYKIERFGDKYGFDLVNSLSKLPIKELTNTEDKTKLIDSLKKGNRQSVTLLEGDGSEQRAFIEASPKFKAIIIYDQNNQRIRQNLGEKKSVSPDQIQATELSARKDSPKQIAQDASNLKPEKPRKTTGQKM